MLEFRVSLEVGSEVHILQQSKETLHERYGVLYLLKYNRLTHLNRQRRFIIEFEQ